MTHQQVVEQDGHHDDEEDPEDVGDGGEGDLLQDVVSRSPPTLRPENTIKLKFSSCHGDGLEDRAGWRGKGCALEGEREWKVLEQLETPPPAPRLHPPAHRFHPPATRLHPPAPRLHPKLLGSTPQLPGSTPSY